MEKTFKYKDMFIAVKTNILKKGVCYFGEKDIEAQIEEAYNGAHFKKGGNATTETFMLDVYKRLTADNVKPSKLYMNGICYCGERLTSFDKQTTIEE